MGNSTTQQQTVLITGASWGFGYELAKKFAQDGYNLVLVARSVERLNEIADQLNKQYGITITILAKDLFSPTAPNEIHQQMADANIRSMFWSTMPALALMANFLKLILKEI